MSYIIERRQEEKERRRGEILDAAEQVLRTSGIDTASMDDIAKQARVSRALLYLYFPDRMALQLSLCERALLLLGERFEQAVKRSGLGLEKVESIGRAYLAFSLEFPLYFKLLTRFEAHHSAEIPPDSPELSCLLAGDKVHASCAEAVREGIRDGSIRSDIGDPHLVAVTLWGFLHGTLQIATTKAHMLARDGITREQLLQQAMAMSGCALAGEMAGLSATNNARS